MIGKIWSCRLTLPIFIQIVLFNVTATLPIIWILGITLWMACKFTREGIYIPQNNLYKNVYKTMFPRYIIMIYRSLWSVRRARVPSTWSALGANLICQRWYRLKSFTPSRETTWIEIVLIFKRRLLRVNPYRVLGM